MNGEDLLKTLDTVIAYENAESYVVRVAVDTGTGMIVAGSGDNSMKVTDSLTVSFSKAAGYKFIKWCAVKKSDESVSMDDYVIFEDAKALETSFKLVKIPESELLIKPFCVKNVEVTGKYPVYKNEGVERDNSIKFTFSEPLSEKNDLSRIIIEVVGSAVEGASNFQMPVIVDNQLVIMSKEDNRISVPEGTVKMVNVTIPSDFTYISNSQEYEIGEEITHSYLINSTTCDKTFITYGTNLENSGTIKVNGIVAPAVSQQYSIGESITVTLKVAEGYKFEGWECTDEGAVLIQYPKDEGYDSNGYNSLTSTATITLLIINESKNVVLQALMSEIPTAEILITSEYGKISPNDSRTYKEGDEISLMFTADSDYQFVKWQVLDKKTGKEIPNQDYITFDNDKDNNTKMIFKKAPAQELQLCVEPYCEQRPKVVSTTPLYDSNGVYRDRRIIVMFNEEMDESSIYYTKDELTKMNVLPKDEYKAESKKDAKGNQYYYAYDDADGNVYFKNIKITKLNDKSANLAKYYKMPYFDANSKNVLRIDTKVTTDAPPGVTDILVTIGSKMSCKKGSELINLSASYEWAYYTNGLCDNDNPNFEDFNVTFEKDTQGTYNANLADKIDDFKTTTATYKNNYLKNKKIWVKGTLFDGGSGPNYIKWTLYKVNDTHYPLTDTTKNEELVIDGKIDELIFTGQNAKIGKKALNPEDEDTDGILIDFTENITDQGLYRIDFIGADKNERPTKTESRYFVYDDKAEKPEITITGKRTEAAKETVSWGTPSNWDYDHFIVERWLGETKIESIDKLSNESQSFDNLEDQKCYEYRFYMVDIYGNKSTSYTSYKDETKPENSMIKLLESNGKGELSANFQKSSSTDFSYAVIEATGFKKSFKGNESFEFENTNTKSRLNKFTITTYDFAGNSNSTTVTCTTSPSVGMIYYSDGYWSKNVISGKTPLGVITDVSDLSKVRVYDLTETYGKMWGPEDDIGVGVYGNAYNNNANNIKKDGLVVYNYFYSNYKGKLNSTSYIWGYLWNEKNKNSSVTWYVPDMYEIDNIYGNNKSIIVDAYNRLNKSGYSVVFQTEDGLQKDSRWWTARPTCYERANVYIYGCDKMNDGKVLTQRDGNDGSNLAPLKRHTDYYLHCMCQVNLQ